MVFVPQLPLLGSGTNQDNHFFTSLLMQAPNVCGGYITGDSGSIEVMYLVRYIGSIKFRLELIETSAREFFLALTLFRV